MIRDDSDINFYKDVDKNDMLRALFLSTMSFTFCFAVWTIFSIIGIRIKYEIGLTDTQFGFLVATPILTGSLCRLLIGILTDQYGGRIIFTVLMLCASFSLFLLTFCNDYYQCILAALGIGLSGGGFAVGIAYVSRWYPKSLQGTALGVFGMGNFGAAVTNFGAPFLLFLGWHGVAKVYSITLFCVALFFYFFSKDDPVLQHRRKHNITNFSMLEQLYPLKNVQVWRFSIYYFFVFGAFVALALWLPRYYIGVYGLDIKTAGILTSFYSFPGSIFRALGGVLSDRYGARKVMYITFIGSAVCLFIMSYPATNYIVQGVSGDITFSLRVTLIPFTILSIFLGFFMSLGKAAVYKHIPVYYPNNVGSVGGIVGLIGGLGGFICPIVFGLLNDIIGIWTSCFMLLFLIVFFSTVWMYFAILNIDKVKN
jgi:NNP family nitrate/nitrite transporter-like MFS transporter